MFQAEPSLKFLMAEHLERSAYHRPSIIYQERDFPLCPNSMCGRRGIGSSYLYSMLKRVPKKWVFLHFAYHILSAQFPPRACAICHMDLYTEYVFRDQKVTITVTFNSPTN